MPSRSSEKSSAANSACRCHGSRAETDQSGLVHWACPEITPASSARQEQRRTPDAVGSAGCRIEARPSQATPIRYGGPGARRCPRRRRRRCEAARRDTAPLPECCRFCGQWPMPISSSAQSRMRMRRRSGCIRPSMNATSSVQTVRKNRVNSASASSLSAPRPSNSLRRVVSNSPAAFCTAGHCAQGRAPPARPRPYRGCRAAWRATSGRHAAVALHKGMHP